MTGSANRPAAAPTRTADPDVVVRSFLDALVAASPAAASGLLADTVWWENVGLPVVRGKKPVVSALTLMFRYATFDVQTHHLAVEVPRDPGDPGAPSVVLTERTDVLRFGPVRCAFWVCGRFEIRDGLIVGWKDYFSASNLITGAIKGVLGIGRSRG